MSGVLRKQVLIGLATIVVVGLAVFTIPRFLEPDLKKELATTLGVSSELLHINVPPAKKRYPGFTYVVADSVLPLSYVERNDPDLVEGTSFNVNWGKTNSTKVKGLVGAGPLGSLLGDTEGLRLELSAKNCKSLEMTLANLKHRLLGSDDVKDQAAKGNTVFVIVRSYEGLVSLRIARTTGKDAAIWTNAKRAADELKSNALPSAKVSVRNANDDRIVIDFTEPIVFAYSVQKAELLTTHYGTTPDDVRLVVIPDQQLNESAGDLISKQKNVLSPQSWAIATATISRFPSLQWLEQPWNSDNADQMAQVLATFRPEATYRFRDVAASPSQESVLEFARRSSEAAKAKGIPLFVFYYLGHAVTDGTGNILLLGSNVTEKSLQKIAHTLQGRTNESPPGNLESLLGTVNDLANREAETSNSVVTVASLYSTLAASGIRFVLLIDGCMQNDQFRRTLEAQGFHYNEAHPSMTYVGSDSIVFRQLFAVGDELRHFAPQADYLRGKDPVIFAAKPGTVAIVDEDPDWEGTSPVAPLVRKARRILALTEASADEPDLAQFVERLVDFRQVGEISLQGSISWSDFGDFERLGRNIQIYGARMGGSQNPIVTIYKPNVGPIRDFTYVPTRDEFFLIANQWNLWTWNPSSQKALEIKDDVEFPAIGSTADGAVYLHIGNDHELYRVESKNLRLLKDQLYLKEVARSADQSSLLLVGESSSVDQDAPMFRLQSDHLSAIDHVNTSFLIDLVEWKSGVFYFTQEGQSTIFKRQNGVSSEFRRGLNAPSLLAATNFYLYCLAGDKKKLYRLDSAGATSRAELLDGQGAPIFHSNSDSRGFVSRESKLLVADGDLLVELDPERLAWKSYSP